MSKNNKKNLVGISAFILVVLALVSIFIIPSGYYVEEPGDALATSELIKAGKKRVPKNYYLVTVAVSSSQASWGQYLWSYTQKYNDRVPAKELLSGQSSKEYEQMQRWYMATSEQTAIYNAAKKAGKKAILAYRGVYVMALQPNSSFKHKLKVGDTITAVDGHKFRSSRSLLKYVASRHEGQKLHVTVLRGKKQLNYYGNAVKVAKTNRAGIGIQLVERVKVKTKPQIKINAGEIGGPSAGLMFSLTCYQIFTGHNLAPGHKVAGTGTIAPDGKVGIIGGIDKKVVAASRQGAEVFFAPTDTSVGIKKQNSNYAVAKKTAKQIHTKMKIVPVADFMDAVNYLRSHY